MSKDPTPLAEPLARAYLDALGRAAGVKMKSMTRHSSVPNETDELLSELQETVDPDAPYLRADVATVAVLAARAIATEVGLAGRLRRGDGPVVIFETYTPDLVELVSDVVEGCALAAGTRKRLIVARDGSEKTHTLDRGNDTVIKALHAGWPIVGIAPDPLRQLPSSLLRMAAYKISLPTIDVWTIRLVLEAVTGQHYGGTIDPDLVRMLDMTDLSLSLRRDLSPEQCLDRLADVVGSKSAVSGPGPTLEQLDGYGEAKTWGLELVSDLKDYKTGRLTWENIANRSLLLSGPPGTGKTSFAKALAKSAGVRLVATSVAEWNTASYLSGTLQAIRSAFATAKRQAPAILFIDELDGISSRTTLAGDYVEYWSQIVNLLLECLSNADTQEGVVVLAATNFPDKIDPAILRAGRIDRHIFLAKPDVHSLVNIFRHHLGDDLQDIDLVQVALLAAGSTGADVEAWVRRAKAAARRQRRDLIIGDLICEIRGNTVLLKPELRRRIAVHEAGHVIAGRYLDIGNLVGVSILGAGGATEITDTAIDDLDEAALDRTITFYLAGRAAEKIILGTVGLGSGGHMSTSDLARATELARNAETVFGFGKSIGLVHAPSEQGHSIVLYQGVLQGVRERLDRAFASALDLATKHRAEIETIAAQLVVGGYLSAAEVDTILDGNKPGSDRADAA